MKHVEVTATQVWALMQRHGFLVFHEDGFRGRYAYTAGLARFSGDEYVVTGFNQDDAAALLHRVGQRVSRGERLDPGDIVHAPGVASWCRVVVADPTLAFRPHWSHYFFDSVDFAVRTKALVVDDDPLDPTLWADFERWEEEFDV